MKAKIFQIIALFFLFSCTGKPETKLEDWTRISELLKYREDSADLILHSGAWAYRFPLAELPFKKVVLLNASLVGYFTELGLEDRIIGISSPEYIYSPRVQALINNNSILNVGNEQKYNVEKIIALKPDAVFTNRIATFSSTYDLLEKNGIPVIFLDEYLEKEPLSRSRYLLLIGKLMGMERKAAGKFMDIKKTYDSLALLVSGEKTRPVVLANEMYGSQWYLPGGQSMTAHFIRDAGGSYINAGSKGAAAEVRSFEEVFSKSQNARIWVNAGNHQSRGDLLQANPNYSKMEVFRSGKIYTVTQKERGRSNDYFESGVVRADLVLKDYIMIFHPDLLPGYNLTYLKELK
ncbi:ABC transporter substrate-binding protein [Chryseobacterium sp.]|uniref:ABC transporter substrate-binding protein n=1 Tax=Chryseobacterium sp. TaxID=1871047 RepID=UPI0012A93619|nr:ABC transporter substrate-binding protein [Chryseobacterium sp.]QFG53068.1 ABC transporter substrate-binding protein [Chryseobacterium sp.]